LIAFVLKQHKGNGFINTRLAILGGKKIKFPEMLQIESKRLYDWGHVKTAVNINNQ